MSINNREDANKYYKEINKLVDDYMESGKIKPSNLKNYMKPGSERSKKFLHRNNYKEVVGIDQVFSDVIEDRVNMERDGILKFENFKFFESDEFKISSLEQCLYKGIEKADRNMEKALANVFRMDLGSIENTDIEPYLSSVKNIDTYKHLFKIDDWGKNIEAVIYTKEELDVIYLNVIEYLYEEIKKKEIELVPAIGVFAGIKVSLGNMIKEEDFNISMSLYFNNDVWLTLIGYLLKMDFKKELDNYFIWVKNN